MDQLKVDSFPPLAPRNPDSPLAVLSNDSLPTNSVDIELRIAEAKERMKQMLRESHDICRKLNFESEDALLSEEEISFKIDLTSKESTFGCLRPREQGEEDHRLISSDDVFSQEGYFSYLRSKSFPVEVATQASVREFHKAGDIDEYGEDHLISMYMREQEIDESVGENKQPRIIDHDHDHNDFIQQSTDLDKRTTVTLKDNVKLNKLSQQVQVLMNQLAGCRRNLLTAEREVNLLCEENRELRDLIHELVLVHGQRLKKGFSYRP